MFRRLLVMVSILFALADGDFILTRRIEVGISDNRKAGAANHQAAQVPVDRGPARASSSRSRMDLDLVSSGCRMDLVHPWQRMDAGSISRRAVGE